MTWGGLRGEIAIALALSLNPGMGRGNDRIRDIHGGVVLHSFTGSIPRRKGYHTVTEELGRLEGGKVEGGKVEGSGDKGSKELDTSERYGDYLQKMEAWITGKQYWIMPLKKTLQD